MIRYVGIHNIYLKIFFFSYYAHNTTTNMTCVYYRSTSIIYKGLPVDKIISVFSIFFIYIIEYIKYYIDQRLKNRIFTIRCGGTIH